MTTDLPNVRAISLTVSVFPVPAGPKERKKRRPTAKKTAHDTCVIFYPKKKEKGRERGRERE